eukprot:Selendium_serpulae@DN4316_c0_g1_i1.p1
MIKDPAVLSDSFSDTKSSDNNGDDTASHDSDGCEDDVKKPRWSCREYCGDTSVVSSTFRRQLLSVSETIQWFGSVFPKPSDWWQSSIAPVTPRASQNPGPTTGSATANQGNRSTIGSETFMCGDSRRGSVSSVRAGDRGETQHQVRTSDVSDKAEHYPSEYLSSSMVDTVLPRMSDEPREQLESHFQMWKACCHPRATKFFGEAALHSVFERISEGLKRGEDPIIGDEKQCVHWMGTLSEDGHPLVEISKPPPVAPGEVRSENDIFVNTSVFVNRLVCYLFASGDSFSDLIDSLPQGVPLAMACRSKTCVAVTHISIDPVVSEGEDLSRSSSQTDEDPENADNADNADAMQE